MSRERQELTNALMDSSHCVGDYLHQRRTVEKGTLGFLQGPNGKIDRLYAQPVHIQSDLKHNSPATNAAFITGAIAYKAYLYHDLRGKVSFGQVWSDTKYKKLAENAEKIAYGIVPRTTGEFLKIDLNRMHQAFDQKIQNGCPEQIVFTGLNACGKSTVKKSVMEFLDRCGLKTIERKFPRTESGPFCGPNAEILNGTKKVRPDSAQLVFLADALEVDNSQALIVCDRHPQADALVYGGERIEPLVLASRELFNEPSHIYILDRHPAASHQSVGERIRDRRIFERQLEAMVEQYVRFAALTSLPGCTWVNADVPDDGKGWDVELTKRRTIGSLISSGIVTRNMVRQGICETQSEAYDAAINAYIQGLPGS